MNVLLLDLGASRIKACLYSAHKEEIHMSCEFETPQPMYLPKGKVEVDPYAYIPILNAIIEQAQPFGIDRMWLCSEMHGVILLDGDNHPITNYISWKDSRGSTKGIDASIFKNITGMTVHQGLPILTIRYMCKHKQLPETFRMCSLIDWLLIEYGNDVAAANATMLLGTGLYGLHSQAYAPYLFHMMGIKCSQIKSSPIVPLGTRLGLIRGIPVYGGIGDLQAAIAGSVQINHNILINLGTGSQIITPQQIGSPFTELRLGARNECFSAITHIPCGRALNVFAKFIGEELFWKCMPDLEPKNILAASIGVGLDVGSGQGVIYHIKEGEFNLNNLMHGIALSWLKQYTDRIETVDPLCQCPTIYVAGGLSRKLPFVVPVLEALTNRQVGLVRPMTGEETLDGLLFLAKENM